MPTNAKGEPIGLFQVYSHPDGEVVMQLHVYPGGNNSPVIDAAYAVLDDMIGVTSPPGDDGGGEPLVESEPTTDIVELDPAPEVLQ